jgi:hypothetical protein
MKRATLHTAALLFGALFFLAGSAAAQAPAGDLIFDVRNGDQRGKLMLQENELAFESLTDSRHSRTWRYADIRELSRKGRKEMRVRPVKGSRYDFQLKDRKERDQIYDLIASRIVSARRTSK